MVVLAAMVVFVFENSKPVAVRFLFLHFHPQVYWLILGALVVGLVAGFVAGHPARRKHRRARRAAPPRP